MCDVCFFSSRRRHTRFALVTGVQTCALPIYLNARTLVNASITLADIDDRYFVRAIARNLTDKRYKIGSQVDGGLWANSQYGPPPFFGVEAGLWFMTESALPSGRSRPAWR